MSKPTRREFLGALPPLAAVSGKPNVLFILQFGVKCLITPRRRNSDKKMRTRGG